MRASTAGGNEGDCGYEDERFQFQGFSPPNDIEFSGERKRVRCNEGLGNGQHNFGRQSETRGVLDVKDATRLGG